MKKIVYIDMDDTIADFGKAATQHGVFDETHMYEPNFFMNLEVIPGALKAVRRLSKKYDIWILTQPLAESHHSYGEKAAWICKHFPELSHKIIMTQDKGLHRGRYLIDDNELKWKEKFEDAGGEFVLFNYDRKGNHAPEYYEVLWQQITDYLNGRL